MMLEHYRAVIGAIEDIGHKWAFYILFALFADRALGFNELKRRMKPVTSKMLSQRLKQLQKTGLIEKETLISIPKRVEYRLTVQGERLVSFFADFFSAKG